MTNLPTALPQWYQVDSENPHKGWTPKTTNITEKQENKTIVYAWNGTVYPAASRNYTLHLNQLKILSPIQVGGGSLPEGMILPATIGGVPYIPGSSIKGALLNYLRHQWQNIPSEEKAFWLTLTNNNCQQWQPRKIRFESILLKNLKPYPLNAQQKWQVFNEKENKLAIQWQVSPKHPPGQGADQFSLRVSLKNPVGQTQKKWLESRIAEMLRNQGIGKGTAAGFGRLASITPDGKWQIRLTGMKPCVQPHNQQSNQNGIYRWSPQVLRANLRSYFTRLALCILSKDNALELSDRLFGSLGTTSELTLTSFFRHQERSNNPGNGYVNIPAQEAHSTWIINVDCNEPFQELIGDLLALASRLGGLGPGWRRPPHKLTRFNGYRGSQFTVNPCNSEEPIQDLIQRLLTRISNLAGKYHLNCQLQPQRVAGTIISIWEGKAEQWQDIVHGICKTGAANRPAWCGNSQQRPSGYAVRQHQDYCWITVFDPAVESSLNQQGFRRIFVN